jgi:hypothetical protein
VDPETGAAEDLVVAGVAAAAAAAVGAVAVEGPDRAEAAAVGTALERDGVALEAAAIAGARQAEAADGTAATEQRAAEGVKVSVVALAVAVALWVTGEWGEGLQVAEALLEVEVREASTARVAAAPAGSIQCNRTGGHRADGM